MALLAGTEYIIDIGKSISLESDLPYASWNLSGVVKLGINGQVTETSFSRVSYSTLYDSLFSITGITYQGYDDFDLQLRDSTSTSEGSLVATGQWHDGDNYAILTSCSLIFDAAPDFGEYQSLFESCLSNPSPEPVLTDLTGTKWVINDGLDPSSFVSKYNGWQINFKSNGNDYTAFGLQYDDGDIVSTGIIYYPPSLNWVAHQEDSSPYFVRFSNKAYRTIEIIDGTDATNATLIKWLSKNAIQIPVADLTGTTWVFNDSLNFPLDDVDYSIDFKSNNTDFNLLSLTERDVTGEGGYAWLLFYGNSDDYLRVYLDEWEDVNYKTIEITGGTDATNSDLILWLQNNAVQQETPEPTGVKNILFGNLNIDKILFGQSEVSKIYLGQTLVWQTGSVVPDNALLVADGGHLKASDGYLTTTEL